MGPEKRLKSPDFHARPSRPLCLGRSNGGNADCSHLKGGRKCPKNWLNGVVAIKSKKRLKSLFFLIEMRSPARRDRLC